MRRGGDDVSTWKCSQRCLRTPLSLSVLEKDVDSICAAATRTRRHSLALSGHRKALLTAEPDEVLSATWWTGVSSHHTSSASTQGTQFAAVYFPVGTSLKCSFHSQPSQSLRAAPIPHLPLAGLRLSQETEGQWAVGLPVLRWCLRGSQSAGYLRDKLVRLQEQCLLGFCACFTSSLNATAWTSWGWDPDTSDAWGMSPTECLAWCQPRAPAACRKYWTFWVLKREPGTVPRLHLIHLLGATEKGVRGSLQN